MNLQTVHYVMLVCAALAAGLPSTAAAFPDSVKPFFTGITAILVLLVAVLGAISPSASSTPKQLGEGK